MDILEKEKTGFLSSTEFAPENYFLYTNNSIQLNFLELHQQETTLENCNRILIYQGKEIVPIRKTEILHVFAEENYRYIRTSKSIYTTNYTLEKLEEILGSTFFRINRQNIVSFEAIDKILHENEQRIVLKMKTPINLEIMVSKRKNNEFKNWLTYV